MLRCSNKQPPTLGGLKQQGLVSCSLLYIHLKLARRSHHGRLGTQANGPSRKMLVKVPEGQESLEGSCPG